MSQATTKPAETTLLDALSALQQFDGPADAFLLQLLRTQCSLVDANGAAILRIRQQQVELLCANPPVNQNSPQPVWLAQAAELAPRVVQVGKTLEQPLAGQTQMYGTTPDHWLVVIPLRGQGPVRGVAAYHIRASSPQQVSHARERLELTVSLLSLYELRLTLQKRNENLRQINTSIEMLGTLNEHGKFRAASMALCNELASRLDAKRVSLGILEGRYVKTRGMSHTEKIDRKVPTVIALEAAMEECLDQDVEVLAPAPGEATFVHRAADTLVNEHGPSVFCAVPIRRQFMDGRGAEPEDASLSDQWSSKEMIATPFAVLTVERSTDKPFRLEEIELLRLIADLASSRIWELHYNDRWLGHRLATDTRRGASMLLGPRHTWLKLLVLGVFTAAMLLTFIKGNDYVEGNFTAKPVQQHIVTAPFEAELIAVNVKPGDTISPEDATDATMLARLDVTDAREQLLEAETAYARFSDEVQSAVTKGKQDEAGIAAKRAREALSRVRLLRSQIESAELYSTVEGEVISNDLTERLGGRVQKGEKLFVIAETDRIQADILIPADRRPYVKVGDTGELASKSDPGNFIEFTITEIDSVAQAVDNKNVFRATAVLETDKRPDWLRPGVEGVSRIKVGEAAYGYLWTRDLINWVRMKLWI